MFDHTINNSPLTSLKITVKDVSRAKKTEIYKEKAGTILQNDIKEFNEHNNYKTKHFFMYGGSK